MGNMPDMRAFVPGIPIAGSLARAKPARTLLLVDDDPLCARFLGQAASECGFKPVVTISAEAFKAQYKACGADVVAMDLAMPGHDGIELLRFLAGEQCRALVLIISGFDRRVVESALRFGSALGLKMGPPLTKPVRFEQIEQAIAGLEGGADGGVCL